MDDSIHIIRGERNFNRDSELIDHLINNKIKDKVEEKKKTENMADISE